MEQRMELYKLLSENNNIESALTITQNWIHIKWHTEWDFWNCFEEKIQSESYLFCRTKVFPFSVGSVPKTIIIQLKPGFPSPAWQNVQMIGHKCALCHSGNSRRVAPGWTDDSLDIRSNCLCADRAHKCNYISQDFVGFCSPSSPPYSESIGQ